MATCLCDAFFDDVAMATVQVLEWAGCTVEFPEGQTCCGQPAFNAGDWKASRQVVRHVMDTFKGENPVVVPSGSCAAMGFHGAILEFEKEDDLPRVKQLANRTWEVTDYLVHGLDITKIPGKFPHKIAFHRSCHSRGTCSGPAANTLLSSIEGVELLAFGEQEQCCGFGGAFSVSFPNISKAMGELKIEHIVKAQPDYLCSADMGCLLHLGGIMDKEGKEIPRRHVIQILRDALIDAGEIQA
ncbi:(Fe-S)-binding protein [Cerasicoccus arenae]|uniref:Lactate utilization protein A n=1 Tax=Cerasicoccus arenae TaxID=424488 RepID=A0A8J3DM70_9BACT|nr:(Fe-S)-binding protein [Cerasicoccus arenae]MBK1858513.1 (Fe-S)-binding protein [Cerasicoccus arenae]GHC10163.1 lactate utilization protein A [Cerasicoccus arenae]